MKYKKLLLPVDIKLPEKVMLENGTMFVTFQTLDELCKFWQEHKNQFDFACTGDRDQDVGFLRRYEWVFGTSKSEIVRTVLRWGKSGLAFEFFDWAKDDPSSHLSWFSDREYERNLGIEKGFWSDENEAAYQADCICRSPETYRGYWRLMSTADPSLYLEERVNYWIDREELIDPNMPVLEVEKILLEHIFESLYCGNCGEFASHDRASIEETIAYWREEEAIGRGCYGNEDQVDL